MSKRLVLGPILFSLALTGCDKLPFASPSSTDTSAQPTVEAVAPVEEKRDLVAETLARGTPIYTGGIEGVVVPPELTASPSSVGNFVTVSGTISERNSAGQTTGISLRVPAEFETAASGKLVRIHAVVSSETAGEAFLAYSTNDVGNSGWMPFPVSNEDSVIVLEYSVPVMNLGQGDYVGIDPNGQSITVKAVSVEVVG
jgi:hypothetical protein